MAECETCGTIHGIVKRRVNGEVREYCVHHARGEELDEDKRVVEYPDRR